MNKNRHIIGELQELFANNDASKAVNSISTIMDSMRMRPILGFKAMFLCFTDGANLFFSQKVRTVTLQFCEQRPESVIFVRIIRVFGF